MINYSEKRIIQASAERVFDTVKDISNYPSWNPWVINGVGEVKEGGAITVTAAMGRLRPKFKHKILSANSPDLFHWCDLGFFTVFAYGERKRTFKALDNGQCEYQCDLTVTGMGTFWAKIFFGRFMAEGLCAEADALKLYLEQQ